MDETTKKQQDLLILLYWIKESFTQLELLITSIPNKEVALQNQVTEINKKIKQTTLSLNYFKQFMVNFQIKYNDESTIIDLACQLAQHCDSLFDALKNENFVNTKSFFDKIKPIKILLIMTIINHNDYIKIQNFEKV